MHTKKVCSFILVLFLCLYNSLGSSSNKVDSVKALIAAGKADTNQVNLLSTLAGLYRKSNSDSAVFYFNESEKIAEKIKWGTGSINAYLKLGNFYSAQDQMDSAKLSFERAIGFARKENIPSLLAEALAKQGRVYYDLSDYSSAMIYYIEALKIMEDAGIKNDHLGSLYHKIGSVFKRQKNYDRAKSYYQKENDLAIILNDSSLLAESLYLISQCEDDSKVQERLLFQALDIYQKQKNIRGVALMYSNLIDVYSDLNDFDKCLNYSLKSLEIARNQQYSKLEMVSALCQVARSYNGKKNYSMALKYLAEAAPLLDKLQKKSVLAKKSYYFDTYCAYKGLLDYKNALLNYEAYNDVLMQLYQEEKLKSVAELETRYETEKKSIQITALEKEKIQEANIAKLEKRKHQTIILSIAIGLMLVLIFTGFILRSLRITRRQKVVIEKQKEEVDKQREIADSRRLIAEEQREVIKQQKAQVEEHQKEILDSITYAKRIQYSLLANKKLLEQNIAEHFILFKPKDIVSGDFYWATNRNNKFYIAACDSTGHGVPGAFMSLLNISFLNEAVNEKDIFEPHEILNHVRKRLLENMEGGHDGMDATIVCIDGERITYAAAYNPPLVVRNGKHLSLEADKMPVGKSDHVHSFTLHTLDYQKGDTLYLLSDGYADQFGGPKGKRFMSKVLNVVLSSIADYPAPKQLYELTHTFDEWKGNFEQVDDVLVIGIKL